MITGCVGNPLLALHGWEIPEYRDALLQDGISIAPRPNNTLAFVPEMEGQPACGRGGRNSGNRHNAAEGSKHIGRHGAGGHRRRSGEGAGSHPEGGLRGLAKADGHGDDGNGDEADRKSGRRGVHQHSSESGKASASPYVWEADAQELLTHVLLRYNHQQVVYLRRPVVVTWGDRLEDGSDIKKAKER